MNYSNIISDFSLPGQAPITVGERMKATEPLYDILAKAYQIREPSGNKTSVGVQPDLQVDDMVTRHEPKRNVLQKKTFIGIKNEADISIPLPYGSTSNPSKVLNESGSKAKQKTAVSKEPSIKTHQAQSATGPTTSIASGWQPKTQEETLGTGAATMNPLSSIFSPKVLNLIGVTCICVGGYWLVKQIALNSKHRKKR